MVRRAFALSPETAKTSKGPLGSCMDDVTRVSAAKAAWDASSDLDRRGTQHGVFRRAFRWVVHFLSYNFILSRPTIRTSYAAGFRLSVRPTVFHPKFFISSEKFASF